MKSHGKWIWVGAALAVVATGATWGYVARSKYDHRKGFPLLNEIYATNSAEVRDDGRVLMGGRSPAEYFDHVLLLLKEQFVDPIRDETPLAHGAVTSMLQSLRDPGSRFFTAEGWKRHLAEMEGEYEGLGASMVILWKGEDADTQLPLTVVSVFEGGPADKAGIKAGDVIEEVDGRWVASRSLFRELAVAGEKRRNGEITEEDYQKEFERLRDKSLNAISINRAIEILEKSSDEPIKLTVLRNGKPVTTEVKLDTGQFEPISKEGDVIRIRSFGHDVDVKLADLLGSSESVTIDIRNNFGGSFEVMERCLALLIPKGEYAKLLTKRSKEPAPLSLSNGAEKIRQITVVVDKGTAREAEAFAAALRDRAKAKVVGGETAALGILCDRFTLSDSSGYTITRGRFADLSGTLLYSIQTDSASKTEVAKKAAGGASQ